MNAALACCKATPLKSWKPKSRNKPTAGASATPPFAPEGGESLIALRERITATTTPWHPGMWAGRSCWWPTAACWTCCTAPPPDRTFKAPRTWQLGNAAINRLLWTPDGLSLVGWADTQHLDNAVRDENHA